MSEMSEAYQYALLNIAAREAGDNLARLTESLSYFQTKLKDWQGATLYIDRGDGFEPYIQDTETGEARHTPTIEPGGFCSLNLNSESPDEDED